MSAMVNCPNTSADSFFVNIDAEPTVDMTWHVPLTSGFELRVATWSGWPIPPDILPKIWTLSAGTHQLIIRGREANAILQHITLSIPPTPTPTPSPTAQRLHQTSARFPTSSVLGKVKRRRSGTMLGSRQRSLFYLIMAPCITWQSLPEGFIGSCSETTITVQ